MRGVALASGEEIAAPIVVAATHPQITFLRQLDAGELPDAFVDDIRNWKSRSGTVKINLALDRAPVFTAKPDQADLTGGFELAHSIAYLERAFEEARNGRAATAPFSDGNMPTYADPTLAPEGKHIVSLFTQWCPAEWADEPDDAELEAYADRVIAGYDELAPGFTDSVLHRQVLGPHEMQEGWGLVGGNIFHGELSAEQLFHMRPAPGLRRLPDADRRAVPVLERDPRRRRRDGHPRLQLRPRDRRGPHAGRRAGSGSRVSLAPWNSHGPPAPVERDAVRSELPTHGRPDRPPR